MQRSIFPLGLGLAELAGLLGLVSLVLTLGACQQSPTAYYPLTQQVIKQAEATGLVQKSYKTEYFTLWTYQRPAFTLPSAAGGIIHIYIEGDGNSWETKYRLSADPTPKYPLGLALAQADPAPQVVYLARPCQYTPIAQDPFCTAKYWSSHRYAPEVLATMQEVINAIKLRSKNAKIILIGFSGGASIAALLAAQRQDVVALLTVAGDLDHEALNKHHRTSALSGSLNPSHIAPQLQHLPQFHFNGSKDKIVPSWVATQFAAKVGNPNCTKVITLRLDHHHGWVQQWPALLYESLGSLDLLQRACVNSLN